jgi:beta-lactamase class A
MKNIRRKRSIILLLAICLVSLVFSPPSGPTVATGDSSAAESENAFKIDLAHTLPAGARVNIAAKNTYSGASLSFAEDKTVDATSTIKLALAMELYQQADEGKIKLDEVVTIPTGSVQRYGTGPIQFDPAPYRYTWRKLTELMLRNSDNTAAYVIAGKVSMESHKQYVKKLGMNKTDVYNNTTTARDMLVLAQKFDEGNGLSAPLHEELLSYTKDTQFEDRLPKQLPSGAVVYHKTGDGFDGAINDVGIVKYDGKTLYIALFSDGINASEVSKVSRRVFSFLQE